METTREVKQIVSGIATTDGDGMPLTRMIGCAYLQMLDPFILFDIFDCDNAQEYIGGFPAHPHRGIETVTYMLNGKMSNCDSSGHSSVIAAGDVQWVTTGKGVIHSEMPLQTTGLMKGLMLWVNLPAAEKMIDPKYQLSEAANIPEEIRDNQCKLKVIAGTTTLGTTGIIKVNSVKPIFWDIQLLANSYFFEHIPGQHTAFVYVISGHVNIGKQQTALSAGQLAVLTIGDKIQLASSGSARLLLVAGQPLNEPVVRAGPFVMNTQKQLNQAIDDYQKGQFI